MPRILSLQIKAAWNGSKIKDVLSKRLFVSDTLCSKLKQKTGSILLNGEPVYVTRSVHTGDVLTVAVHDFQKDSKILPMPYPLPILYEDADLIVLDKPSGISIHPARDPNELTVENALAAYLGPDENPHPVNRLDKGTSGVMCVAKSGWAHSWMKTVQHTGQMEKTYLAICEGHPSPPTGCITSPIGFMEGSGYFREIRQDGAACCSTYQVLESLEDRSLVQLSPKTGRMHQLRVHMASIGHPLLGDWLYGKNDDRILRVALHSYQLTFVHPLLQKELSFTAPLPLDMQRLLPPKMN
ncbi:MAG: RluA family pseudouridine synthase [Clostridia bacterium]|nr:RluA family pseudouridine synthase [Clostridia bacterium]